MANTAPPLPLPALAGDVGVWCTGEEFLRVSSANADADTTVRVGVRFQNADRATPQVYSERHAPNTDRTVATSDHRLGTGWLQGLTVFADAGTPLRGQTFVRVDLMRASGAAATLVQTLVQGYVSQHNRRGWPGGALESALEGPGALRLFTGTDPAAGAEWSETVPTGARWRLLALLARFVTDATAANRRPILTIDDGATAYFASDPAASIVANTTVDVVAGPGTDRLAFVEQTASWQLPVGLQLLAGHRVRSITGGLQAGDNWGAPQLLIEEHLEP